jgi:hypothetical protein
MRADLGFFYDFSLFFVLFYWLIARFKMMVLTNEVVVSGDCCFFCNACGLAVLSCPSLGFLETKNDFGEKGWLFLFIVCE